MVAFAKGTPFPSIRFPLALRLGSEGPLSFSTRTLRSCVGCDESIAASESPKLVVSPTVGTIMLPESSSFQAWINTRGGVGDGSGRTAGFDSAKAMASPINAVAFCGLELTQKVDGLDG